MCVFVCGCFAGTEGGEIHMLHTQRLINNKEVQDARDDPGLAHQGESRVMSVHVC